MSNDKYYLATGVCLAATIAAGFLVAEIDDGIKPINPDEAVCVVDPKNPKLARIVDAQTGDTLVEMENLTFSSWTGHAKGTGRWVAGEQQGKKIAFNIYADGGLNRDGDHHDCHVSDLQEPMKGKLYQLVTPEALTAQK